MNGWRAHELAKARVGSPGARASGLSPTRCRRVADAVPAPTWRGCRGLARRRRADKASRCYESALNRKNAWTRAILFHPCTAGGDG
jgi:hypothetical protein